MGGAGAKLPGRPCRCAREHQAVTRPRVAMACQNAGFERNEIRKGDFARADLAPELGAVARDDLRLLICIQN